MPPDSLKLAPPDLINTPARRLLGPTETGCCGRRQLAERQTAAKKLPAVGWGRLLAAKFFPPSMQWDAASASASPAGRQCSWSAAGAVGLCRRLTLVGKGRGWPSTASCPSIYHAKFRGNGAHEKGHGGSASRRLAMALAQPAELRPRRQGRGLRVTPCRFVRKTPLGRQRPYRPGRPWLETHQGL